MRYALPQPVTRHAVDDCARMLAGSVPVRRGIAVVAVVGGALSFAGAAPALDPLPVPRDALDDGAAALALAADRRSVEAPDDDSEKSPAVMGTGAIAESVREANEEGRRLAAEDRGSQSDDEADDADDGSDDRSGGDRPGGDRSGDDSAADGEPAPPGRTASRYPAELIDTDKWYLTLPTGKKGKPDTIDGSELATYHSEFFGLNEQRDGIVFSAGADGVTTKNSRYPRSELREMDGGEKASWSNTSGTHVFDVREAFTKLPEGKAEVVGIQIHDGNDDVLQIRLEGRTLMVQYHDGRSEKVLDPDYRLGTPFDARIVAADGKVDVFYNGQKKAQLPLSGSGWYWKVGAYVQSNSSHGDGADSVGEVEVFRADITHSGGSGSDRA